MLAAAYAIPDSLAYAMLAGVPPQMGLYCYLVGGLGYALFGSSRNLAIGPTSAISLLLGVSLFELAADDAARQAELASLTALVKAGVFVVVWLLRLSVLVIFISESILTGFNAGAALVLASLVMLLARVSRPYVAFLDRIPGTNCYSDVARHPDNEPLPSVVAFRPQSSLLYFNCDHVLSVLMQHMREQSEVRCDVGDLSNVSHIDVAGARMLRRMHQELSAMGSRLCLIEAHGPVRDLVRAEGLEEVVGSLTRLRGLAEVIKETFSANHENQNLRKHHRTCQHSFAASTRLNLDHFALPRQVRSERVLLLN